MIFYTRPLIKMLIIARNRDKRLPKINDQLLTKKGGVIDLEYAII